MISAGSNLKLSLYLAWRNIWRNAQRSWISISSIAFGIFLVTAALSMTTGALSHMQRFTTGLFTGDIQIQMAAFWDEQRIDDVIANAKARMLEIKSVPGVAVVAPRLIINVLASVGERGVGAQLIGIDPVLDPQIARLSRAPALGRGFTPGSLDEVILGAGLARTLGLTLGSELIILGAAPGGGSAAMILTLVGIFDSGSSTLDRSLLLAPIAPVAEEFDLVDKAHALALALDDGANNEQVVELLQNRFAAPMEVRGWKRLIPELAKSAELEQQSVLVIFGLLLLILSICLINVFVMILFERTRELGVLKAIGMKPDKLVVMLQLEAFCLWGLGTLIGLGLSGILVLWLGQVGWNPSGDFDEVLAIYDLDGIYPALDLKLMLIAPLFLLAGTQLAAFIPGLRLWKLAPVNAIREGG